MIELFKEVDF